MELNCRWFIPTWRELVEKIDILSDQFNYDIYGWLYSYIYLTIETDVFTKQLLKQNLWLMFSLEFAAYKVLQ